MLPITYDKTRLLVTGANGFVGSALCNKLHQLSVYVRTAVRAGDRSNENNDVVFVSAIDGKTDWNDALSTIDVVVHVAARVHVMNDHEKNTLEVFRKVNTEGTMNLARQAASVGVRRFIYISSIKVNGESTKGRPFTEDDSVNPQDAYAISKYEAEQGLLQIAQQTGMEVVIIRPPLVYGVGVKANFATMLSFVKRGVLLPLGAIHNKRSLVYVENLVSLILRCIDHPAAANQVFLVSDGCDLSTTELLHACAVALGVKSRLLPIPQTWLEACARVLGKKDVMQRLCGSLQVDISKARTLLDWTPSVMVQDGLKRTALELLQGN